MKDLVEGSYVTVQAKVVSINKRRMNRTKGNILQVVITDGSDYLHVTFSLRIRRYLSPSENIKVGENILFSGVVSDYNGVKQLVHPEFESVEEVNKNIDLIRA